MTSDFIKTGNPGEINSVVYISDMVHSKDVPRDYYKRPIKDLADAESCAQNDFVWLNSNRKIDVKEFDNLDIKVRFTGGGYENTQNEQMRYYWKALFNEINPTIKIDIQ